MFVTVAFLEQDQEGGIPEVLSVKEVLTPARTFPQLSSRRAALSLETDRGTPRGPAPPWALEHAEQRAAWTRR